jgi:hypothetical protein
MLNSLLYPCIRSSDALLDRTVNHCLSVFIPINKLAIFSAVLSSIAIAGGLYFVFVGFRLLVRKRQLLATPRSEIRSAVRGLVEVNGRAAGPHTIPAPITGKPCFLYQTIAWRQRDGEKQEWEKVADETLHLPFFIDDCTGQLLIEPLGAELELRHDFHEEYDPSFSSLKADNVPPRVSAFLSRHGILPGRRLRIEEFSIKPEDTIFVAGMLTENPGIPVRPSSQHLAMSSNTGVRNHDFRNHDWHSDSSRNSPLHSFPEQVPAPQVIRLAASASASGGPPMGQQAKIAAALTRAGIANPEAWTAAGVSYQTADPERNTRSATLSTHAEARLEEARIHQTRLPQARPNQARRNEARPDQDRSKLFDFDLTPPMVLMKDSLMKGASMKGSNDPMLVISFRSQKELLNALDWKSPALLFGGAAITLLGVYVLLKQTALL